MSEEIITVGKDCKDCKFCSENTIKKDIFCVIKSKEYYYGQRIICDDKEKA